MVDMSFEESTQPNRKRLYIRYTIFLGNITAFNSGDVLKNVWRYTVVNMSPPLYYV